MSIGAEPLRVAPDLEAALGHVEDVADLLEVGLRVGVDLFLASGADGSPNGPTGHRPAAVKSPRISTATWPRSWNMSHPPQHDREAEVDVGGGRVDARASPAAAGPTRAWLRSSFSEMTSTAPPHRSCICRSTFRPVASVLIAPSAPRRVGLRLAGLRSIRTVFTAGDGNTRPAGVPARFRTQKYGHAVRTDRLAIDGGEPAVTRPLPLGKGSDLIGDDEIAAVTAVLRDRVTVPLPLAAHAATGRRLRGRGVRCVRVPVRAGGVERHRRVACRARLRSVCGRATRSSCLRSRSSRR